MFKGINTKCGIAVAAMALLGAGTAVGAQQNQNPPAQRGYESTNQANQTSRQESQHPAANAVPARLFAQKAAQDDIAEIKLGKLAEDKGSNPAVKDFGKRIVRDHTKNLDQLKAVAAKQNIQLPTEPNHTQMITYDKLSNLSASQFDKMYAKDMVKDHVKAVREFKEEARGTSNPGINQYAQNSVPALETHLRMARNMLNTVNGSTSAEPSGTH